MRDCQLYQSSSNLNGENVREKIFFHLHFASEITTEYVCIMGRDAQINTCSNFVWIVIPVYIRIIIIC